jgi:hypothetical protein
LKEGQVSLGGWGSTAIAGGRPAMTVITIEVQGGEPNRIANDPTYVSKQGRAQELQAHAISIREVFLGPP